MCMELKFIRKQILNKIRYFIRFIQVCSPHQENILSKKEGMNITYFISIEKQECVV